MDVVKGTIIGRVIRTSLFIIFCLFTAIAISGLFLSMGRLVFMKIEQPRQNMEDVGNK